MPPFQKQRVGPFLDPTLDTPAIQTLTTYLTSRFSAGRSSRKDAAHAAAKKPDAVVIFEASGSGKTTTVLEAAGRAQAHVIIISPNRSPALAQVLRSCAGIRTLAAGESTIARSAVEGAMEDKFSAALQIMMGQMASIFRSRVQEDNSPFVATVDQGNYKSPTSSPANSRQDSWKDLVGAMRTEDRLVIHVDDCQHFFKGVTSDALGDMIPVEQLMAVALRCFSKCITPYAEEKPNICWVITGTRPNLPKEITLAGGLDIKDMSKHIADFNSDNVAQILRNYFDLPETLSTQILDLCNRLAGPPSIVSHFLGAATEFDLKNADDLETKSDEIEAAALEAFKLKIVATWHGNLDQVARSLALLHVNAVVTRKDHIETEDIPGHLIRLIDAGLLRVRRDPGTHSWKISAPNRFLIQIFRKYVSWFTSEKIRMLTSLIETSSAIYTVKGKVFEFLFALELGNAPDCKLWKFLREKMKICALASWDPSVVIVEKLTDCIRTDQIYVIQDPDRGGTKVDVIFFASIMETRQVCRVLCQLKSGEFKKCEIQETFEAMMKADAQDVGIVDYRVFIGPKMEESLDDATIHKTDYVANRCYLFLGASHISKQFQLDIDLVCDPEVALDYLKNVALEMGDVDLASQLARIPSVTRKSAPLSGSTLDRPCEIRAFNIGRTNNKVAPGKRERDGDGDPVSESVGRLAKRLYSGGCDDGGSAAADGGGADSYLTPPELAAVEGDRVLVSMLNTAVHPRAAPAQRLSWIQKVGRALWW